MSLRTWVGGALALLAIGATAAVTDGRHPVEAWLLLGPWLALAAVGLLTTSLALLWALPLPAVAVLVGSAVGDVNDPVGAFLAAVASTLIALVVWLPAVRATRWAGPRRTAVIAAPLLVVALALPVVAVAEARRTVRADRPAPLLLDERAGTFRGIGLGASRAEVRRRLGPGVRGPDDENYLQPDVLTGPSSGGASAMNVRYGRDLLVVFDDADRVSQLWITDPRARTRAGLGVGDSMRLFARAYGAEACKEGGIGSDWPIPFPECDLPLHPVEARWLYVGGTYERAGAPSALLVVSTRDVYAIGYDTG